MSTKDNPCRKFQANIFNKSKCQNCFKPRESHLLNDEDLNQAKPIYGGWLLLAPDGTDFDNPVHRSRKWQRRFFILYEHGLLRYALDEMPTTLPQGTINMNQCTDVVDGEGRTGQKFSLCILTPDKEHYIRAENKEIINGWMEMLIVYPRTNKQNQKKKRKVEPPTPQEPGPAKMAVTSACNIPTAERIPTTKSTLWQEELRAKDLVDSGSRLLQSPMQEQPPPISSPAEPVPERKEDEGIANGDRVENGRKARVESGYFSLEKTKPDLKPEELQPQPMASPPSPGTPSNRYSSPVTLFQGYSDPFSPPGTQLYKRAAVGSSVSSLDSDLSSSTQTSVDGREGERSSFSPSYRANRQYTVLADIPRARRISNREAFQIERKRLEQRTRARSPGREEVARLFGQERRRSQVIEKFEALDIENVEQLGTSLTSASIPTSETRQGRSDKRVFPRKRDFANESSDIGAIPDVSPTPLSLYRRAKSLDRRSTESSMTPDLLNFKKGWLTKLYEDGQWKKHWFVLTDQSLRYYRDSVAEEAADLDGEIDLSSCYDVTEFPVQRNYGFQIHTKEGKFTLSAMTSGIRRNWIETIMKHVRPTTAPDVTSSLPEQKSKVSSSFEVCPKLNEKRDSEQLTDVDPEQKRSRARERRREGRSKTFDWAEFRPIQQALVLERAQAAESMRSAAMIPGDPIGSETDPGELERERARRREERRKRFETVDMIDGPSLEDASKMEVDRSPVSPVAMEIKQLNVHSEIAQRWHQVETTPLREEKQIPISPLHLPASPSIPSSRLPSSEFSSLLEKELEQSQKEISNLLEQNRLLQSRLKEAIEQQQNARDGYVLQTEVATSPSGAWQSLHQVNEALQIELEAQCQRQELISQQMQALKHSYGEAKEIIRHHEAETQSLQARLSSAVSDLAIKEQILTKLKCDLKMEKENAQEQLEAWQHSEKALSSQLENSEQKLKSTEALLLEKTQELRDPEMQQALQRHSNKEVEKLQDRLTELSRLLRTSEQSQMLTEERLKKSYEILLESGEKERQVLMQNMKEVEDKVKEYEDRLQANEQQMEVMQKEILNGTLESSEIVHQLEEQLVEKEACTRKLAERIKDLDGQREKLHYRCQEMEVQVAKSDSEAGKLKDRLKMKESEYCDLESLYEKLSKDSQKVHMLVEGKEAELVHLTERHERELGKKDQAISELLIKMAALGSSLEETEKRLQAKEHVLKILANSPESYMTEMAELCSKLEAAENRISELEQNLQAECGLPVTSSSVQEVVSLKTDQWKICQALPSTDDHRDPVESTEAQVQELHRKALAKQDTENAGAKRQRIRFSNIQCQKYGHVDGSEKLWASSTSSETSQDRSLSEESVSSEPSLHNLPSVASDSETYLSIIHSLETKLFVTEEKLKDVTMKVESQKSHNQERLMDLHNQWSRTEAQLREQLQNSLLQINILTLQLEEEQKKKSELLRYSSELGDQEKKAKVLSCMVSCREKLKALLGTEKEKDLCFFTLSSMEATLANAIQFLQQVSLPSGYWQRKEQPGAEERPSPQQHPQGLSAKDRLSLLSKKIDFEASLINQIAESLKNARSKASQTLQDMHWATEMFPSEATDTAAAFVDILAKKLQLESDFWNQAEELSKVLGTREEESKMGVLNLSLSQFLINTLADDTLMKAELNFVAQRMRGSFHQTLKSLEEDLQNNKAALQRHRVMLEEAFKAYETSGFDKIMHQISELLETHGETFWNRSQPELVPYQDEIKREKSQALPECSNQSISLEDELAQQLKERAMFLKEISTALLSLSPEDLVRMDQKLQEASQSIFYHICRRDFESYSSLSVQDAVLQVQLWYTSCRVRLECEREITFYKDAWRNVDAALQEQTRNLASVRQEYEEVLRNQQSKYFEMVSVMQRERAELEAKTHQLDCMARRLEEAEKQHKEDMLALKSHFEEEMNNIMEKLARAEDTLKVERCEGESKHDALLQHQHALEKRHTEEMGRLEGKFQLGTHELQVIHEGELKALQDHYIQRIQQLEEMLHSPKGDGAAQSTSCWGSDEQDGRRISGESEQDSMSVLRERIQELEAQMNIMRDELELKHLEGSAFMLKEKYQKDFENLKATCERGFAAMEETHQKKIEDLQRQHQRELEKLQNEKERLLAEETAATISAIEAMKNAHREELERELEKMQRSQISSVNADIEALRRQYLEEVQSVQRELEVLSEQYSQKCLENAHLAQALEAERQALRQCQRENQELNAHNQELNNRLAAEITRLRTLLMGEGGGEAAGSPLTQGKDIYELEVLLRVKESEIQYQKQEIGSLKDELHTALRDKKYASDKYKDIYTELSIVKAKAECDIGRLKEQLKAVTEALGEKSPENTSGSSYDIMKSKSNPDFLKKDRSSVSRQLRNVRSKSLKEGLTVQERLKLFESRDLKKH
ncbi:myosin phosphatase Rho-interacting protein isoform X1 [Microcaecilia unicolor]|uniref:Myosin phosphatase Rho-interacting protein isoform X1 n=1 Tax=Microcaecilia unicolor TaxID=1415580 RepID=A0A6P7YM59_9AMPH|nr:myosin phosphatase Rho-interacting protein isoform X1 [Microcaecilia unicolor]